MSVKKRSGTVALQSSVALDDGKAPTSIVLLKNGLNESDHYGEGDGGKFVFDDVSAAFVMQKFERDGRPRLYADWNHGMLRPNPSRDDAAASCSFVPQVDGDGNLVATDIQWTDDGREDVESRAYNLFSPAYSWAWGDDGVCRVTGLVNFALVNLAGLKGIPELMAAAAAALAPTTERTPEMDFEKLYNDAKATIETANARIRELEASGAKVAGAITQIAAMSMAIGLKPDAGDSDRLAAMNGLTALRSGVLSSTGAESPEAALNAIKGLTALRSQVFAITGKDGPEAAVAALQVMKTASDKLVTLESQLEQERTTAMTSEWNGVWQSGVDGGRIPPAEVEAKKAQLLAITGGKLTKELIEAAKTVAGGPANVKMGTGLVQPKTGASLVTDADRELHAKMGGASPVSLEEIAAHREKTALAGIG